jgi:hypothetical protein
MSLNPAVLKKMVRLGSPNLLPGGDAKNKVLLRFNPLRGVAIRSSIFFFWAAPWRLKSPFHSKKKNFFYFIRGATAPRGARRPPFVSSDLITFPFGGSDFIGEATAPRGAHLKQSLFFHPLFDSLSGCRAVRVYIFSNTVMGLGKV